MVLRTSGRVGSRRFTESPEAEMLRGFFCALADHSGSLRFFLHGKLVLCRFLFSLAALSIDFLF